MSLKSKVEKIPGYNKLVLPVHFWQAVRAARKYNYPAKKMRVIGVTGTNGKTTTCFMIWEMLNESGRKTGILSTVGWATGADDLHQQIEHMTTERVEVLNERIRQVREAGAEFLVLEVTSHALAQYRTWGVPIEVAVMTNVTHEHLDYHGTFEKYRTAKMKLFKKAKYGVINADDSSAEWFIRAIEKSRAKEVSVGSSEDISGALVGKKYITYGIKNGDLRAEEVKLGVDGVEYACGDIKVKTQIPGKFNVYNSLAAVAVGKRIGLSNKEIEQGIYALESVEGRMNRIREGQDFEVIVDYAHTPDALEKVFASLRPELFSASSAANFASQNSAAGRHLTSSVSTTGQRTSSTSRSATPASLNKLEDELRFESNDRQGSRIIAVHGGAGRRDESTRAMRGEILGKNADIVIITEDDTRDEDPQEIAQSFVEGAEKAGKVLDKDLFVELDRRKAIRKAVREAKKGDLVLILGKGHEKTILRGDKAEPFEDIKVAKEELADLGE